VALLALGVLILVPRSASAGGKDEKEFQTARGVIAAIQPGDKHITVKVRKGDDLKLTFDDRTRFLVGPKESKLDQFKEGMRVKVTYYNKDGKNRLLTLEEPRPLEQVQKGLNMAFFAIKMMTFKQQTEYRKNLDLIVRDVDDQIATLKERAEKEGAEGRKQLDEDIQALRQKRDELNKRMKDLATANADNWDAVRTASTAS